MLTATRDKFKGSGQGELGEVGLSHPPSNLGTDYPSYALLIGHVGTFCLTSECSCIWQNPDKPQSNSMDLAIPNLLPFTLPTGTTPTTSATAVPAAAIPLCKPWCTCIRCPNNNWVC
mmetsp:Transcript_864/g.1763  ORF Transcript_864/g.1763 Transcript_864/m.1763 type:complete len:117 (+) Transcript_864:977-1327(+)